MSTSKTCGVLALALPVLLALGALPVGAINVSLDLSADPVHVARGQALTFDLTVRNQGPGKLSNATLYAPLPGGLDQWGAEVRVDGANWEPYPANGLLPLAPLGSGAEREIEIRMEVELGAPGSLPTAAEVLASGGPLASAFVDVNVLPSVDAGPDLIAEFGGAIELAAASAGDGGDGLSLIEWSDAGAGGRFDDPGGLRPTYTPAERSGVSELTLRVVDSDGGESSDSLRVRVNAPPTVDAGLDLSLQGAQPVELSDAIATDLDGWIVSYAWDDGGAGGEFLPSADVLRPTYDPSSADPCSDREIILTLTVVDDWGGTAHDRRVLEIKVSNQPPIAEAGPDVVATGGEAILLTGTGRDPEGGSVVLAWTQLSGPAVSQADDGSGRLSIDAPEVDDEMDLVFRLTATDLCGSVDHDDLRLTVLPSWDPRSTTLDLSIEAFDRRGIPISPWQVVDASEPLTIVARVTNRGDAILTGLEGSSSVVGPVEFDSRELGPWTQARAEFTILPGQLVSGGFGDGEIELRIDVEARGFGPGGSPVAGAAQLGILIKSSSDAAELHLRKTIDRTEAAIGDVVVYTYVLRNGGASRAEGLSLTDDRLGPIPLPQDFLEPGESLMIDVPYTIRVSDLPGPLTNVAILTSFDGETGLSAETDAEVSIELVESIGAGGGLEDGGGGFASTGGNAGSGLARSVVISEVAWAGSRWDPSAEWIELANVSGSAVDLSGWSIRWPNAGAEGGWFSIPLSGTIEPLAWDPEAEAERLTIVPEGEGWRMIDRSWSGSDPNGTPGYFLLERASDEAVPGATASLVYGANGSTDSELPDGGTILYLHDASGQVIDTANASSINGWLAGDAQGGASMERLNLLRGDEAGNWQTHPGILTHGGSLLGTAGMPNVPSLDRMGAAVSDSALPLVVSAASSFALGDANDVARISVSVLADAAGGGGSAPPMGAIQCRTDAGTQWLDINPEGWSGGILCVWVSDAPGQAYVLVLAPGS